MPERPSGPELLEVARHVLRTRLLPQLPEAARYEALMAANAMAIAAREAEAGTAPLQQALERLAQLYGEPAPAAADGQALLDRLTAFNRRLAQDIRTGTLAAREAGVRAHLRQTLADQLSISNPRVVQDQTG